MDIIRKALLCVHCLPRQSIASTASGSVLEGLPALTKGRDIAGADKIMPEPIVLVTRRIDTHTITKPLNYSWQRFGGHHRRRGPCRADTLRRRPMRPFPITVAPLPRSVIVDAIGPW